MTSASAGTTAATSASAAGPGEPPEAPTRPCDVLVVGGGPAGLLLAILLQQRGVDAVVLERQQQPRPHSRAIGLHPPALAALAAAGLDEAAIARGAPICRGAARSRYRHLGSLSFERSWPERPYVLSLPQSLTEELLTQRLTQLAPGTLHRGVDVVAIRDRGEDVQVTARRTPPGNGQGPVPERAGSAAGSGGAGAGRTTWRARVVVGADGARSTVRELSGIRTHLRTYPDTYLMGDVADPDDIGRARAPLSARTARTARTATIHLHPGGVVESFPLPGRGRRWVAHTGTTPAAPDPDVLAAIVRRRTGARIDPATTTMISAFAVQRRTARTMVRGRRVLIGDAAHEISPIGGQGITLGWLDALALAPLLEQVITRDLRHPLSTMPLLRSFDRSRRRAARAAGLLAELNMALGRPRSAPFARVRDVGIRAVLRTSLRHRMAWAYSMGWATLHRS